jgi:hypothetical protein
MTQQCSISRNFGHWYNVPCIQKNNPRYEQSITCVCEYLGGESQQFQNDSVALISNAIDSNSCYPSSWVVFIASIHRMTALLQLFGVVVEAIIITFQSCQISYARIKIFLVMLMWNFYMFLIFGGTKSIYYDPIDYYNENSLNWVIVFIIQLICWSVLYIKPLIIAASLGIQNIEEDVVESRSEINDIERIEIGFESFVRGENPHI